MYNSNWFNSLIKPPFTPPFKLFAPIWSFLYATIIISLIIYAFKLTNQKKFKGYLYFGIQMLLNVLWSPAFFYLKNIWLALIIILLLDIFVILTVKHFYSVSKLSAFLLIPYTIWILYATYLNIGYLVLN